jgi:exopolysaccharide biosynthesis WecB/TagA/CpsF family protein
MPAQAETVIVGGLRTAVVTRRQLAEMMVRDCMAARAAQSPRWPRLVFSSNGQGLALATTSARFREAMEQADIVHADGMSVVAASRVFCARPLPERVATTDFIVQACEAAAHAGLRFYFLGGSEKANAAAVARLKRDYPRLIVVGRHHGYFDEAGEREVIDAIRKTRPDVLWLGTGKPDQEYRALRYRELLPDIGWIKTCGGLFDHLSGVVKRAPSWMQGAGLEWLFRAAREPRRLAWRYLTTMPIAIYALLTRTRLAQ